MVLSEANRQPTINLTRQRITRTLNGRLQRLECRHDGRFALCNDNGILGKGDEQEGHKKRNGEIKYLQLQGLYLPTQSTHVKIVPYPRERALVGRGGPRIDRVVRTPSILG